MTAVIPKLSSHAGPYLYREYVFSNTNRKAANCKYQRPPSDTIRCKVTAFQSFTRQFSSVEYSAYFLFPITRPGWDALTLLSSLRLI
jgi:hypothetical protein